MTSLGQPGDIEPLRQPDKTEYALSMWPNPTVDQLNRFVLDLYSVGAVGDEKARHVANGNMLTVRVASDDLWPKTPGQEPVRLRYTEWRALHRTLMWLRFTTAVLAVLLVAAIAYIIGRA